MHVKEESVTKLEMTPIWDKLSNFFERRLG